MSRLMDPPPKFLPPEWRLANQIHYGNAEVERSRSERLTAESKRLIEESGMAAKRMQQDANKRLEQRIHDIKFWRTELDQKLEEVVQEIEVLISYKSRVERALESCAEPLRVALQCLTERQRRVSIDLVHDDVERELMKEREVIEGVASLLNRTLEQTNEQIRLNRSAKYYLEKDLGDKFQAEQIDGFCSILTSTSPNIDNATSQTSLAAPGATVTPEEWETFSNINILKAEREKNNSLALRALVDSLLEQMAADMRRQHKAMGTALRLQVQETKAAKGQLEDHLVKVLSEVASQECNLEALRVAIDDKAGPLKVAQTRLSARSQRPSIELCHDPAQVRLLSEVQELTAHIKRLREAQAQSEMELLALTRSQLILEEEIQVKSHSLYIDEVICTQLRQPISIHSF
ncbi:tektin-1 [Oncorhynchus tshawytscha]|uniref:Tektin n=1 Tax=Oncorhynchus tshawytscha TaxID=74940 RepID=A0A8C8FCJ8_ONCTS|nr:tektin-1 [Oncorhynchus tshawytscha]XP_024298039.1 tektin-1 [Oncorhynchus tshawytscha]XP_024298040.1 tektin-1 [Oncorhynchus tshawytscha]